MNELIARRQFTPLYIFLDLAFLAVFAALLLYRRKYAALLAGFLMGLLYMVVDYGIFHLLCHARSIEGGSLFWVLLWMSMSYGFTKFVWVWLWFSKDKHLFEWSALILLWWFSCPLLAGGGEGSITIQRTTGSYHGVMAAILFISYLAAIVYNLVQKERKKRISLPWLLSIGILVQFGWEANLLLGGIRSAGFSFAEKLRPLIVNSLLETNLGMPLFYLIFIAVTARYTESLQKRKDPLTLTERIAENNAERVREQSVR